MSFREKSAWITLLSLLLVSFLFLMELRPLDLTPAPSAFSFHVFGAALIVFAVITLVAHLVVALRAPREARAPKDERERLIALKATSLAAKVYGVLSMGAVSLVHFGANGIGVGWAVLFSFVLAEMVSCVARIVYHRRGV
jgi:integral membrane sensor domain MASE1